MLEILNEAEVDVSVAHMHLGKFLENDARKDGSGTVGSSRIERHIRFSLDKLYTALGSEQA
jgi:hypothetical protein